MNKLGFIVGHPTQFESPFYQFVTKKYGKDALSIYYYEYIESVFVDAELGKKNHSQYGIDVITGYAWHDMRKFNLKAIREIIRNNQYVIVNGYPYWLAIATFIMAKLAKKPAGLRMDTVMWNNQGLGKRIYKKIVISTLNLFVDTFWVTGTKTKEYLLFFKVNPKKIKTFSYVVDNDWFYQRSNLLNSDKEALKNSLSIPLGNKVILCVTKLMKRESPIKLINAFHKLSLPNTTLLVVGDGEERNDLEEYVYKDLKNQNIVFAGYVKYTDLPTMYAISDLFVHPSLNEPWGVSVQEAMACGLPVITSDFVGAGFDLIKEGQNGFLYSLNDEEELADKMKKALNLNRNMVLEVNQKILGNWNYEQAWIEIDNHVLSKQKSKSDSL